MIKIKKYHIIILLWLILSIPVIAYASTHKVLVIMSYDYEYAWVQEVKQGIENVLGKNCIIKYFSLSTKKDFSGGRDKARQAYELFKTYKPDGVIAVDDNAQSMFVVPYLKSRVQTPVIFCGVNASPEEYGYPASNVTGIVERVHFRKTIVFAQQLDPTIKRIAYIMRESPTSRAVLKQFKTEQKSYPAHVFFKTSETLDKALATVRDLKEGMDALFFGTMEGVRDNKGNLLTDKEIIPIISKAFGKPILSNNLYHVKYGTLCAVIKTGQEQGKVAAEM
ncbi:ABC transporter substrate binding protein, partial [Desulfobacterales bacterium HSG17]|nr:ABC transporter substrate binding protein [Desulfobacterales bacterium HSG17]